jgi:uncharacterized protein (DUF488 family)
MIPVFTIGHSRHSIEKFTGLLRPCSVAHLVDVRRMPWSRFNPQFNCDRLDKSLSEHGIGYSHFEALGGLRRAVPQASFTNTGWSNEQFRNYADYALTPPFRDALQRLCYEASRQVCAIMCAEADWRHCHRQIISDYLIVAGLEVCHIMPDGSSTTAHLTPFASMEGGGSLAYRAEHGGQGQLDFG